MHNSRFCFGLDIGKGKLHLCQAGAGQPKDWPVTIIDIEEPDWYLRLLDLIPPNSIIGFEPTGWHYSRPLVAALEMRDEHPMLVQINHQTTAAIRKAHISRAKNDVQDARALAYITKSLQSGQPIRGAQEYQHFNHLAGQVLRLHVNSYRRLTKQTTRNKNILRQLGHSIWPRLGQKLSTWLNFIDQGIVTPEEIHAFIGSREALDIGGKKLYYMRELAADLPGGISAMQPTVTAIRKLAYDYRALDDERQRIEAIISDLVVQGIYGEITHRWRTVPFLGDVQIAALHIATAGRADELTKAQFTAAVGAAPNTGVSGSIDKTRAGKGGYRPARDAVFMVTKTMLKPANYTKKYKHVQPIILDYFNSGHNAAACRRKLAGILSGIARAEEGHWPQKKGT